MLTLGIDTSNYTTSVAAYDSDKNTVVQFRKLLPVKPGERGIRQSDAVFHHTAQLFPLYGELVENVGSGFEAVGASARPRNVEGSYMPCFTVGLNTAGCIASTLSVPAFSFSHQCGHLAAAVYSCGKPELFLQRFIAFHVSGGTTEMLLVEPDEADIFKAEIIGGTSDLNAGQAIDRTGVRMGVEFPCGKELEKLANASEKTYIQKIRLKDGYCSLSGVENKCNKMLSDGEANCDTAKFCLDYISSCLIAMTDYALAEYGNLPLLYAGGVMSDSIIRNHLSDRFECCFASPELSCDNACGAAIMAYLRKNNE